MRILHKLRSPEKEKIQFTERELCILYYYAVTRGYNLEVRIPKKGRRKIYIIGRYIPLSYSWYIRNPEAKEENIDWTKVSYSYL